MQIAVIGAGVSGLACAAALQEAGHRVVLFEKSAGVGGRMSTRRMDTVLGEASFDHGAPYFTADDPGFRILVEGWQAAGLAAPWPPAGPGAFVGVPGMNAPARRMADGLDVRRWQRIELLGRGPEGWRLDGAADRSNGHDAVVVAVPAEQAAALLRPVSPSFAARAVAVAGEPCWTVMASFAERLPVAADVVRNAGGLAWAARNSAKPGRTGPEAWVLQASPDWSRAHLEDAPGSVVAALLALFAAAGIVLPEPASASAHRWRYARFGDAGAGYLWDKANQLGVCGDWLLGAGVEGAWRSGTALAAAIGAAG